MRSSRRSFLLATAAAGGTFLGRRAAASAGPLEAAASNAAGPVAVPGGEAVAGQTIDTRVPTAEEIVDFYRTRRNWGRWGPDDQVGAVNLITPQKRVAAAALVKTGRTVSLSRLFEPPQHFVKVTSAPSGGGYMQDYYGYIYHGSAITHVDALSHSWIREGMWNGRDPAKEVDTSGARFGDITAWSSRLITRGVLIDVPRHRRESHVTADKPVHGWELEQIAKAQGVDVGAGDALLVYSGREAYDRAPSKQPGRPGLHASCAKFIRDRDVAVLVWDLMDACEGVCGPARPDRVHAVIANFGIALVDNAQLEPLAAACLEERRYEFMFVALPLRVLRGSGSAANPTAIF
jgi:kynurenine formamidase